MAQPRREPLTEREVAEIERLAGKLSPVKIARRLNRSRSTVWWRMLSGGLIEHLVTYKRTTPFKRGDRWIRPFDQDEDAMLLQLRMDELLPSAIAAKLNERFGRERTAHTVRVRLHMLASSDGAET